MSEVSRLKISLKNSEHTLRLAMPIGVATAELCDLDYEQSDDDELERTYLVFREDGFELLFDHGQLSGVFLYLSPNRDNFPAFGGELNYLPRDFFVEPCAQRFIDLLTSQGFMQSERKFPNSTDMLDANVRLRYQEGPTGLMVFLDDGNRLR